LRHPYPPAHCIFCEQTIKEGEKNEKAYLVDNPCLGSTNKTPPNYSGVLFGSQHGVADICAFPASRLLRRAVHPHYGFSFDFDNNVLERQISQYTKREFGGTVAFPISIRILSPLFSFLSRGAG